MGAWVAASPGGGWPDSPSPMEARLPWRHLSPSFSLAWSSGTYCSTFSQVSLRSRSSCDGRMWSTKTLSRISAARCESARRRGKGV